MKVKFEHEHGIIWIGWVGIVFSFGLIVFFLILWPNLPTLLESFSFNNTEESRNALFWVIISIWLLLSLRGAKVEFKK